MAELQRCPSCGASVRPQAEWCGQCQAVLAHAPEVRDEEPSLRRPMPEALAIAAPQTFSRWRKSETSFGPVGRILWTIVLLGLGVPTILSLNPLAFVPYWLIAVPLVLRSLWAKKRIT